MLLEQSEKLLFLKSLFQLTEKPFGTFPVSLFFFSFSLSHSLFLLHSLTFLIPSFLYRPRTMGGRAGGEKYMVHNILFKFAVDSANLFQGSTWAAAKVCNCFFVCWLFVVGLLVVGCPLLLQH